MSIEVAKVELKSVQDASGLEACLAAGQFAADEVVAVIAKIPMVWSGGCDGVITPHATVFARNAKSGSRSSLRLAIGTAMSAELLPEDIGRPAMVEKVAAGVKAAMRDAAIDDPKDVHYVQTKTPLLTIDSVRDAETRGQHVACEVH